MTVAVYLFIYTIVYTRYSVVNAKKEIVDKAIVKPRLRYDSKWVPEAERYVEQVDPQSIASFIYKEYTGA
jgi:hypothetical protein